MFARRFYALRLYSVPTGIPSGRRLTRAFAKEFCDTIAETTDSLATLSAERPGWPTEKQLYSWRERNPWFAEAWRRARERQGEYLAQTCLQLAKDTNPTNAHSQRVKFDIYWKIAARFHPAVYGDKPAQQSTVVNVGVAISAERLQEIKSKLGVTREALNGSGPERKQEAIQNR